MVKLGSIIASLLTLFGALRISLGFIIAFTTDAKDNAVAAARYLAAENTGEAINEGMVMLVVGVVIGLLVKIAKKDTTS